MNICVTNLQFKLLIQEINLIAHVPLLIHGCFRCAIKFGKSCFALLSDGKKQTFVKEIKEKEECMCWETISRKRANIHV